MFKEQDIRSAFLDFFVERGHKSVKSSSLIPENDPTLMFTNSGMVQFKDVFTGKTQLPYKRATTVQKCLRAGGKHNDLDNVGYTARHHTFFEMMGNFSFGDYFKTDAIAWAWEFVTKILQLPQDKLLVTVHSSDEEAIKIWKKVAELPDEKIIKINTSDNFWTMGPTGPCGPCSEIFYDHGESVQGGMPGTKNEDGDRYVEIWNLVFTQFNALDDGTKEPLAHPCIDTGMGLERVTAILQGVNSNYKIDVFQSIIEDIKNITNIDNDCFTAHYNVIADHMRAICFMIADGITPSNDGRGYVLRRIIRRAVRHGYTMGVHEPFLYKLVDSIEKVMGDHYTEIGCFKNAIIDVIKNEEECFMKTIDNGMVILNDELKKLCSCTAFPEDIVYKLYDTYGFPIDLTKDILRGCGKTFHQEKLDKIIYEKKQQCKNSWTGTGDCSAKVVLYDIKNSIGETEFIRNCYTLKTDIMYIIKDDATINCATSACGQIIVVTKKTPFYAECGGQIGDIGQIIQNDCVTNVWDTKSFCGVTLHLCSIESGILNVNQHAMFNVHDRIHAARNHTCTHILQKVLQEILGGHVVQKGSFVSRDKLRFDFLHNEQISHTQLHEIENAVNYQINKALLVTTDVMEIDAAIKSGAMALFGEKYGSIVRVVKIGDNWSKELCGGTHVDNTMQIKNFKIINCSSIGSGIKRIEAITGDKVIEYLEAKINNLERHISEQGSKIKNLEKKAELRHSKMEKIEQKIGQINVISIKTTDEDYKNILNIVDEYKKSDQKLIVFIENKITAKNKTTVAVLSTVLDIDLMSVFTDSKIKFGGKKNLIQTAAIENTEPLYACIAKFLKNYINLI